MAAPGSLVSQSTLGSDQAASRSLPIREKREPERASRLLHPLKPGSKQSPPQRVDAATRPRSSLAGRREQGPEAGRWAHPHA